MRLQTARSLKTLHFDIETRRVGFFSGGTFKPDGCEPIAIACSWADGKKIEVRLLGETTVVTMLVWFRGLYKEADVVSGHYIRKFDLPILNGAMLEHGLPLLPPKLVSDTQQDLTKRAGLSASQENLGAMFGLRESKVSISDHTWRGGARLDPEAMQEIRKRVVGDVRQHKELRAKLLERGALKPPRVWAP